MIEARAKLWLEKDGFILLGKGRAELLRHIQDTGSISEAARSMEMSYSHAWSEVKAISQALGRPVIETSRGGPEGGSSRLTQDGLDLLNKFQDERKRLDRHLAKRKR